ncbi:NACHT and WD domain-containing protein [Seiridium cupressi]
MLRSLRFLIAIGGVQLRKFGRGKKKGEDKDSQNLAIRQNTTDRSPSPASVDVGHRESRASIFPPPSLLANDASSTYSSKRNDSESGPLGLNVVYTPDNGHKADIVFVHGLGGTSRWTWSKNRKPELFWPLTFLPLEPDICLARILSFGYDAGFHKRGVSTSVLDFAKDLLFDLKYGKDAEIEDLNMGKVPLLFVVHSMGGLIVKEAYMQGQNDPEYESIIKAITAITFLSTPHRGTSLAQTLNRILDSIVVTSSKQYVADLVSNSITLQKLNEQFRHIAPRLDIVSLYETLPTPLALNRARVMVLEKDSSILGYPGEISKALNADHHGVCKYDGKDDPNYITVRNILKSLMSKIIAKDNAQKPQLLDRRASLDLKALLSLPELPGMDYIFFWDQWTQGTNDWILDEEDFLVWRDGRELDHAVLWVNGGAATGKSVLASFVINHLIQQGRWCQYFFIRFGDMRKRSLSLLLRSLAIQFAQAVPGILHKINNLSEEALNFETVDPKVIWDRIFKTILFQSKEDQPLYWVVDGLDEAKDPRAIIKLLSDIESSQIPIRILFVSRKTSIIESSLEKLPKSLPLRTIQIEGHPEDIRRHIKAELNVPGNADFRAEVEQRILEKSQNNFLWVRLAVDRVNQCHSRADVDMALRGLPAGMETIFGRMSLSISELPSSGDKQLATKVIQYVYCAVRTLSLVELSQALGKTASDVLDFPRAITETCGGFVVLDNGGNAAIIHQTARDYLFAPASGDRPFTIDQQAANKDIFLGCMGSLMVPGLRARLSRNQKPEFLNYSATSWSSHLASASVHDHDVVHTLRKFLTGHSVLTWIHILADDRQLQHLVQASKNLSRFLERRKKDAAVGLESTDIIEQELLESWTVDLLRIVGKFGGILRRKPDSIYKLIPPFCPKSSPMYQLFGKAEMRNLSVSGLSSEAWDDSVARITLSPGQGQSKPIFASSILAKGSQIAILAQNGNVFLYRSADFAEAKVSPIKHGERVERMQLNNSCTLLVTYGYRTLKVWELSSGKCKISVDSIESKTRPLTMLFIKNDSSLLVGTDDRRVRSLDLVEPQPEWQVVAELDEIEIEKQFTNSASHMALNYDGTMVAVAYRRYPLSVWETDGPIHIGHCRRKNDMAVLRELRQLIWHPNLPELLAVNLEGTVIKWAPYEDEVDEVDASATKLSMSKDGNLFVTGDGHGRIKLYATSSLTLLYQLAAQDAVFGLAFSPDSSRFYDIRGYYGNAWEPNALIRLADADHSVKESDSMSDSYSRLASTGASTVIHGAVDSITALAGSPNGRLYCCGTERGVVSLFDIQFGKISDIHISPAKFTIEHIHWSDDGRVCFTDMSKQVTVMSVTHRNTPTAPIVEKKATVSMRRTVKDPISQLLFQPDGSDILVCTTTKLCVISLDSSEVERSHTLENTSAQQWIVHPSDSKRLVGFAPTAVHVFDWDLVQHGTYNLSWPKIDSVILDTPESLSRTDDYRLDRVLVARDQKHILMQLRDLQDRSKPRRFFSFETSAIPGTQESVEGQSTPTLGSIPLTAMMDDLSYNITDTLSMLWRDRLVFISKTFSICSTQLQWGQGASSANTSTGRTNTDNRTQELFSLPGDWISRDSLAVCSIWGVEKAFLSPRNGEVAVVRCGALV